MTNHRYNWPISNSSSPDEMNTSFGPRINKNRWDFHDGIDLPAPKGTKVYAMADGVVHQAGPGKTGGYSSRHVVIWTEDDAGEDLYNVYLHLDTIDPAIKNGEEVKQGQQIGTVGADDATYPHLHLEFRRGTYTEIGSVHPLNYLPYVDTHNFTAPVMDAFQRSGQQTAVRLLFGAASKLEGDLKRVEVQLEDGATVLETRVVDFDDKTTIKEGNGDQYAFTNDIAVEGYQKSDMTAHGRSDLRYGIVLRDLPQDCHALVASVMDVSGNISRSSHLTLPEAIDFREHVDFSAGFPPDGWTALTSTSGSGTSVEVETTSDHPMTRTDAPVMVSIDASVTETTAQRAAIEYTLPERCFQLSAEAWFNVVKLDLNPGQTIYLLEFTSAGGLFVAARLRKAAGPVWAGLSARRSDGTVISDNSDKNIQIDHWHKWNLSIRRIGTRETTAVLSLDKHEVARLNCDTSGVDPSKVRAGIARSSAGAKATVLTADLRIRAGT